MRKIILAIATLSLLSAGQRVFAAENMFKNPTGFADIQSFIAGFLKAIVILSMPVIALFIVVAGFKFLSARGKPTALGEARDNFKYVIYGAILILGAWALAVLIWGTVNPLINGGGSGGGGFVGAPGSGI